MNSIQLKCFLEVAKQLNYARAAETLHFSQPTVSKQIQSLENELGVRLFDRSTRSVSLTRAGIQFFPDAKIIYSQELLAIERLAVLNEDYNSRLLIGTYSVEIFSYIATVYSRIFRKMPSFHPDIVFAPYQSLTNSLKSHSVDLILGVRELMEQHNPESESFQKLTDAPVSFLLSGVHADKDSVLYKECMQKMPDLNRLTEQMQDVFHIDRRATCPALEAALKGNLNMHDIAGKYAEKNIIFCDNVESALALTQSGNAFLILPQPVQTLAADLIYLPVKNIPRFSYGYFYNKTNKKDSMKLFAQELEKYFSETSL